MQLEEGKDATDYIDSYVISEDVLDPALIKKAEEWRELTVAEYIENIFTSYIVGNLSNVDGSFTEDDSFVVSDEYIPAYGNENYVVGMINPSGGSTAVKVAFYRDNLSFISITDFFSARENTIIDTPVETRFIKAVVAYDQRDAAFLNVGETPYFEVDDNIYSSGFSDLVPGGVVEKKHLSREVTRLLEEQPAPPVIQKRKQSPFPKKLRWETVYEDPSLRAYDLSRDGKIIYAGLSHRVFVSKDDGETWEQVTEPNPAGEQVLAVRETDDGELLITTARRESENKRAKIFKTEGYDRSDFSDLVGMKEVLEAKGVYANFNNTWGLECHDNIIVASEYGQQGIDGARYAFLSTDYGDTWREIFDQKESVEHIDGAPDFDVDGHLHTIHYDRYRERIWLAAGDQANCATYYSDDMGNSWKVVKGSVGLDAVQYTGIVSYPEAVFFGSDRVPDGVHYWRDEGNKDNVKIEPFYLTERASGLRTLVYGRPFRRYAGRDEVTYFSASRDIAVNGEMSGVIVGFKGVHGAQLLYDFTDDFPDATGVISCLGETANGYIVASIKVGDDYITMRAKAPVWE